MALKSGRVGVAKSEVDSKGKIKGGSSDLGGLKFRVTPEGQAQYKTPNGEWVNFNSGAGGLSTLIEVPQGASKIYPATGDTREVKEDSTTENWSGYIDISMYKGKKMLIFSSGTFTSVPSGLKTNRYGFYKEVPTKGVLGSSGVLITDTVNVVTSSTPKEILVIPEDAEYLLVYSAPTTDGERYNIKSYVLIFE